MSKVCTVVLFYVLLFPIGPAQAAKEGGTAVRRVDFATLWSLAQRHSPTLKSATHRIARFRAYLTGSKLLYAPTLSLSFHGAPAPRYECIMPQEWLDLADRGGLSEKEFRERYCVGTNRDDSITFNLDGYAFRLQVKAVQPLYTFGKIHYVKAMAKAALRGSKATLRAKKNELHLMVRQAWYSRQSVLLFQKLIGEAQAVLKTAKETAEEYEEEGKITPIDLIRLKLGENEILRRKLTITKMGEVSRAALSLLAGRPVEVVATGLNPPRTAPAPLPLLLKRAMANLPQVKMLSALRAAKVAQLGLAKAAFLPNIGLFVRYTLKLSNSDNPTSVYANDGLHGNSLAFGVGLNMKLDPGKMVTELRVARVELKEVESKIAAATDLLRMRLTKARQEVVFGIQQISLLVRAVKLSRSWAMALKDQEKAGKLNPKDLIKSLTSYYKYRFSLVEARYRLAMAWATLEAITRG